MSKKRKRYPNAAYSGNKSKSFWQAVNDLANDADRQELYSEEVNVCNTECVNCFEGHCNHNRSEVCYDRKIL